MVSEIVGGPERRTVNDHEASNGNPERPFPLTRTVCDPKSSGAGDLYEKALPDTPARDVMSFPSSRTRTLPASAWGAKFAAITAKRLSTVASGAGCRPLTTTRLAGGGADCVVVNDHEFVKRRPLRSTPLTRTSCDPNPYGAGGLYEKPFRVTLLRDVMSLPSSQTRTLFGSTACENCAPIVTNRSP